MGTNEIATDTAPPETGGYNYQRADGTIERALSVADAIARCPVLGRLALQAPDQANMLLELAAAGKARMQAEAKESADIEIPPVETKPSPAEKLIESKKRPEPAPSIARTIKIETPSDPVSKSLAAAQAELIRSRIQSEVIDEKTAEFVPTPVKSKMGSTRPWHVKHQAISEAKPKMATRPAVNKGRTKPEESAAPVTIDVTEAEEKLPEPLELEESIAANVVPAAEVPRADSEEHYQAEATEHQPEVIDMIEPDEAGTFDAETIETYRQLVALSVSEAQLDTAPSEAEETLPEKVDTPDFEAFVVAQPAHEEPVSLEVIKDDANNQPLEYSLTRLTEYLAAGAESNEDLSEIIDQIAAALPACYANQPETMDDKPIITAELTQKILQLLAALGYEQPGEVVINFVDKHGLAFLLQALEHLCQLDSKSAILAAVADEDSTRQHLGKLLFGLISRTAFEPTPL